MFPALDCPQAGRCGGCPWIERPWADQRAAKLDALAAAWGEAGLPGADGATLRDVGPGEVRDRADLSFRRGEAGAVLGLWDRERGGLVPVGACPMATPALRAMLVALADDPPPVDRASLRARVAPDGAWGLWVDAANEDIKALLDEQRWLLRWRERAFVELGQRRKPLGLTDAGLPRLIKHTELRPWFQTWLPTPEGDLRPVPLYGTVGGFTQAGHAANRLLVERVSALIDASGARRWLELGAGQGNFTLPLAARAEAVTAVEMDRDACQGLERSAAEAGLDDRVDVVAANMHRHDGTLAALLEGIDAIFVDPPRSGLLATLDALAALPEDKRPAALLYVSCFLESLTHDLQALTQLGWVIRHVEGVDQFPQSPHAEWIVLLGR